MDGALESEKIPWEGGANEGVNRIPETPKTVTYLPQNVKLIRGKSRRISTLVFYLRRFRQIKE